MEREVAGGKARGLANLAGTWPGGSRCLSSQAADTRRSLGRGPRAWPAPPAPPPNLSLEEPLVGDSARAERKARAGRNPRGCGWRAEREPADFEALVGEAEEETEARLAVAPAWLATGLGSRARRADQREGSWRRKRRGAASEPGFEQATRTFHAPGNHHPPTIAD